MAEVVKVVGKEVEEKEVEGVAVAMVAVGSVAEKVEVDMVVAMAEVV
jgi:hypothetical protein